MKDIPGYEGRYAITSCGKIWSYSHGKFMKTRIDKDGYELITLWNGQKNNHIVHRLLAQTYIPNPNDYPEINHKDEIKNHNWINNLEWCTTVYNINYGTRNSRMVATRKLKNII